MKKKLSLLLSFVLVAAIAILGTLAYLTDTDSDVNVMTLGNVKIEQNEYEWNEDGSEIVDFTQAKPLLPYVGNQGWKNTEYEGGAYRQFTMNNALDKYVTVKNTGKSDAYVRTVFAFEMGELTADEWDTYLGLALNADVGATYSFPGSWTWEGLDLGTVANIDGHNYMIYVGTHKDAIAAGEETVPSLLQVYMTNTATNEIVDKVDGNKNGTYDILVFSQAVQAQGFSDANTALDTAFGKITTTNHPWSDGVGIPTVVSDDPGLDQAFRDGGTVIMAGDMTTLRQNAYADTVLDMNGKTLINNSTTGIVLWALEGNSLTVTGNGKIVDNSTIYQSSNVCLGANGAGSLLTVENGYFDAGSNDKRNVAVWAEQNSRIVINGGTFTDGIDDDNGKSGLIHAQSGGSIEINGGFFSSAYSSNILDVSGNGHTNSTITVKGGTYVNYNPAEESSVYIKVADGYKVVSETQDNGDIWYTVVAE